MNMYGLISFIKQCIAVVTKSYYSSLLMNPLHKCIAVVTKPYYSSLLMNPLHKCYKCIITKLKSHFHTLQIYTNKVEITLLQIRTICNNKK